MSGDYYGSHVAGGYRGPTGAPPATPWQFPSAQFGDAGEPWIEANIKRDKGGFDGTATAAGASAFGVYGAIAGAALDIYKGFSDRRRYQRHLRRARQRGESVISNYIEPPTRAQYGKARDQFEEVPGIVKRGFESARERLGESARGQAARSVGAVQAGAAQAENAMLSQGIMASSVYANLRMGTGAQVAWVLQDIYDRMTQADIELTVGGAQAEAQARAQLGNFYERENDAMQLANRLRLQLATMR